MTSRAGELRKGNGEEVREKGSHTSAEGAPCAHRRRALSGSYLLTDITSNPTLAFDDGGDRRLTISHHAAVRHENRCRPAGEAVTERNRLHRPICPPRVVPSLRDPDVVESWICGDVSVPALRCNGGRALRLGTGERAVSTQSRLPARARSDAL